MKWRGLLLWGQAAFFDNVQLQVLAELLQISQ